jgi:hypothetical protein
MEISVFSDLEVDIEQLPNLVWNLIPIEWTMFWNGTIVLFNKFWRSEKGTKDF